MFQAQARLEDSRIEVERRLKYQGTARVRLDALHFHKERHRPLETKHIEYLKKVFDTTGCRPLEPSNSVPALIAQHDLDAALRFTGISPACLLNNDLHGCQELRFPRGERLECLHGQHRIQAGREFLRPRDHWWTVELYLTDTNDELKTCLIEAYSNEEKPSDGEIYCKIRMYHFLPERSLESRWEARLCGNRSKNYKSLTRHRNLLDAFDTLRDIPGLWNGMRITTLHTIIAMKCDEQIIHYLNHIKEIWTNVVGEDIFALRKIDQATVKALELKAPRASTFDANILRSQVLGGEIFNAFGDEERSIIWGKLQLIEGMIPSLYTFFRDVLYLQECVDCLKHLTTPASRDSLFGSLERDFKVTSHENLVVEQLTESTFISRPGSFEVQVDLGIRQLVAFAMRHLYDMPRESDGKDKRVRSIAKADKSVLRKFADLAQKLGFDSPQINALKQFPMSLPVEQDTPQPIPFFVTSGPGITKSQRCGPPRRRSYEEDRVLLFARHLHSQQDERDEGITSLYALKHIYLSFFGKPEISDQYNHSSTYDSMDQDNPSGEVAGDVDDNLHQKYDEGRLIYLEAARAEAERLEAERVNAERLEAQRLEAERINAERLEAERVNAARVEAEKLEAERVNAERLEAQRLEAARLESERLETARLEAERQEAERVNAERLEAERLDAAPMEAEKQLAHANQTSTRKTQLALEQFLYPRQGLKDSDAATTSAQELIVYEEQARSISSKADVAQARITNLLSPRISGPSLGYVEESISSTSNTQGLTHDQIQIDFKIRERGVWRIARPLIVSRSDPSEVERVARKYLRKGLRPFNTKLSGLNPKDCFHVVTEDGTNTILLIPHGDKDIVDELIQPTSGDLFEEADGHLSKRKHKEHGMGWA